MSRMKEQLKAKQDYKSVETPTASLEEEIATITGSEPLALAVSKSVDAALKASFVHLGVYKTARAIFNQSLNAAIRDIENHPRGKLFRRLIQHGPPDPDDPEMLISDGETILSDPECGSCVDFIYSHMITRFKGEVAELLALEPCVRLIQRLQGSSQLPEGVQLYWGELIQERRRAPKTMGAQDGLWSNFTKGADGLLVRFMPTHARPSDCSLMLYGIIEVKSMARSVKRVLRQIDSHQSRLSGGVRLGFEEWDPNRIRFARLRNTTEFNLLRVIVLPSQWKLSRDWSSVGIDANTRLFKPREPSEPPGETHIEQFGQSSWKITLAWSQEALNAAAHQMTYWYMSQVGAHVFAGRPLPKGLEQMTPEKVGVNQIKARLYVIPLRYISRRQVNKAVRLYNSYCFSYPLATEAKTEALWPDDFPEDN